MGVLWRLREGGEAEAEGKVMDQEIVPMSGLFFGKRKEKRLAWGLDPRGDKKEALGLQSMERKMLHGSQSEGQHLLRPCCRHDEVRGRNNTDLGHRKSSKLRMRKKVEDWLGREAGVFCGPQGPAANTSGHLNHQAGEGTHSTFLQNQRNSGLFFLGELITLDLGFPAWVSRQ